MKLPKISYDPVSKLIDLLIDAGIDKLKEKADRSPKVIAIRNQLGLGVEAPLADDFDGVYAFSLAKYYEEDNPKAILEFFGHPFIKSAFRKSFEQRNFDILEDETENFLDWNYIGKLFKELDIQPQAQFERYQQLFYESIELTKRPIDFVHRQKDEDLNEEISLLRDEVQEIKEGKEQVLPPPFTLPPIDIKKFTGREEELKKLENLIFNQECSRVVGIVGLTGTGGMGKSALAVYFANKYKDRFPDGIVGIRVDRGTTDEIARSFALQVVTKVDPELKAPQIMQRYFQNRQALLILDNVEDATAREFEPGGDKCAVIITTRNRNLNLGTTGQIDLNRFSLKETHDLLVSFLDVERVDAEPEATERLHELVGGLPLAVRIVGGALAVEKETTLDEFANRLEDEKRRLYLHDPNDKSLDVHASVNISLKQLDKMQVYLFSCLSACSPEGFSSDAVKGVSQHTIDVVKENLAYFVKLSLLDFNEDAKCYLLHPLLFDASNELARGKNKEVASKDIYIELLEHHTDYFRDFAKQNKGLLSKNLHAIEKEIDELLLTAKRLIEKKNADYGFYLALEPFFQNRGYWAQAMGIINSYLKIAKENQDWESVTQLHIQHAQFLTNTGKFSQAEQSLNNARQELKNVKSEQQANHLSAMILNSLGGIYQKQGSFKEAVDTLQQSYELLLKLNDESGQAKALNSLGGTLQRQGKFDEAIAAFQKSADIEEKLGNQRGQAMVLNSLGGVLQRKGNFDKAADAFQKSATIEERLSNERGQAMVLNSLGGVLQRQGDFDSAVKTIKKSHQILVKLHDERGQAMVLNSLGGVYQRQGKFDEAVSAFQKSAIIEEKLKNDRGQAMVLNSLGGVLQRQGKFDEAVTAFQKSYDISERLEDDRSLAMVLNSLGGVLQRQGKFDEAVEKFQQARAISERLNNEVTLAMVLNSLGGVLQRQGKFDEAVTAFQKSYDISERLEDDRSLAMVLNSLGGVLQRQGKFDEAVEKFQQARAISERLNNEVTLAMVLNSLGGVLQRQGKFDEAINAFQRSLAISERLGDERSLAMVSNSLGGVLQRQGKFEEAIATAQDSLDISNKAGDQRSIAMALNSLGGVLQRQGKFDEAINAFQRSVDIGEKLGDYRHLGMALNSLGGVLQRQGKFDEAVSAFRKGCEIAERHGDENSLAMRLNSLGGVLQRQGKFDEAVTAFQKSYELLVKLVDDRGQAMVLNSLGGVLQRQGKFDDAVNAFQKSIELGKRTKDKKHIAMALNSLGGVFQRQGKFDEAVLAFQQSAEIEEKLKNERGQAMVLNSLGGVLQQQGKFDEAVSAFQKSFAISEKLDDELSLAMVHFSIGKMYLEQEKLEKAREHLVKSFELNEKMKIAQGMRIVTPSLTRVLSALVQHDKAKEYAHRALVIVPDDKRLLRLLEQLSANKQASSVSTQKSGHIKNTIRNLNGYLYGFIIPDDAGADIYFGQDQVDEETISKLSEGLSVWAEVEMAARGPRAKRVWLKE